MACPLFCCFLFLRLPFIIKARKYRILNLYKNKKNKKDTRLGVFFMVPVARCVANPNILLYGFYLGNCR